jgi:hypothetical protein
MSREKRGAGEKKSEACPEATGSPRKLAITSYCILPYLVKKRACMLHGNVISSDLAASGDPMEYRRTRRKVAVTH